MMRLPVLRDISLASRTTLGVGGPASRLIEPLLVEELRLVLRAAANENAPVLILGGGSNMLVADAGFDGVVISPALYGLTLEPLADNRVRVVAGAGVEWDELVTFCVDERLAGIEALSGIPGRCGAAPIQNIGAYGAELADVVDAVRAVDRLTGAEVRLPASLCGFGYRTSRFKSDWRDRYVITAIELLLVRDAPSRVAYAELRDALGMSENGPGPKPAETRRAVLALRRRKSMLYDPEDANHRSAGSFFINPILSGEALARFEAALAAEPGATEPPRWQVEGGTKLSAAWLIEQSGFRRGHDAGNVGLSSRHALALINRGGALAGELVAFAGQIRGAVHKRFGVTLTPEPVFVGFDQTVDELLDGQ